MQKHDIPHLTDFTLITPTAQIKAEAHGWRAKCLQRLIRLDLPVPKVVALPAATVKAIAGGMGVDTGDILEIFGPSPLVSVRPSPANPDWGGPGTVLNVGMNAARHADLRETHGAAAADMLYLRFIQAYATHVARLDPDMFAPTSGPDALKEALRAYEREAETPFPQDPSLVVDGVKTPLTDAYLTTHCPDLSSSGVGDAI